MGALNLDGVFMRRFPFFTVVIKDDERAFLTRDGKFQKLLGPGRFKSLDLGRRYNANIQKIVNAEVPVETALLLEKTHQGVANDNFEIVQTGANEVAIVSLDGQPRHLLPPLTTRAFWKTRTLVDVEVINTADSLKIAPSLYAKLDLNVTNLVTSAVVHNHQVGLLYIDGKLIETLEPGRHVYWNVGKKVEIATVDTRPQPLEVTAQEILTKDRVGIRVTLTAFYKIVDPVVAQSKTTDVSNTLYRLIQFAIREAVATRTLDEILAARDEIDSQVRTFVGERAAELGAEVGEIGVKDVILPGDVRDLLNKVVEAERTAKANLIRRQEETAATRSLLNTSKLMDNNPLLLRLKELEALEKLVEKVGRIDLHAGQNGGLDSLLSKLYTLKDNGKESE